MKMKKNKLEELKFIIVVEGDAEHIKKSRKREGDKTVVGAIQVGQNPRHVCLTDGVCLVHVSVQAQQRSR